MNFFLPYQLNSHSQKTLSNPSKNSFQTSNYKYPSLLHSLLLFFPNQPLQTLTSLYPIKCINKKNSKMKNKQQKSKQNTSEKLTKPLRTKNKKNDIFDTAPITCNIFQNTKEKDFTYEIKEIQQKSTPPTTPSPPSIHLHRTQYSQPTQINLNIEPPPIPKSQSPPSNTNQLNHKFIYHDQSSSQNQQQINCRNNETVEKKMSNKYNNNKEIIFVNEESSSEEEHNANKNKNNAKIITKNTIQVFGQILQIDVQVKQQPQKPQSNKIIAVSDKPKQLLTALTHLTINTFAKLKLIRDKTSLSGNVYTLFLQANLRFILSAKNTSSQTYILSDSFGQFEEDGKNYLGKIKSSFFSNEVHLFTAGCHPEKEKQLKKPKRQLICTIITHYQEFMEQAKPRDFSVYMLKPGLSYYKDLVGFKSNEYQISLNTLYDEHIANREKIYKFDNRKSKWNEQEQMHSLNMKSRAKIPSIKNFILESPAENGRQIMLFGKIFDIHYPLNPIVGMAVAMASFAQKSW